VKFSLVTAVYNVEPYLREFIDAMESQTFDHADLQVIAVDDGSTDNSGAILDEWAINSRIAVTVIHQSNAGQASARNNGLPLATGDWITFIDPDDTMNPGYFQAVADFLAQNQSTNLVSTNRLILNDKTGTISATHPLAWHFAFGAKLVDLDENPRRFVGSAPASFFRRELIDRTELRFDETLRPNFEDGHFVIHYLLSCDPLVGFVPEAEYNYRKRAGGNSTLQLSLSDPRRFTTVMENGYLDVLRASVSPSGKYARPWIQSHILYELSWVFRSEDAIASQSAPAMARVGGEFRRLLGELLAYIDPDMIRTYNVSKFLPTWRDVLLHGLADEDWSQDFVVVSRFDEAKKMTRISYRYRGVLPNEVLASGSATLEPAHAKTRSIVYFGAEVLRERILWVRVKGRLTVHLNGVIMEIRPASKSARAYEQTTNQLRAAASANAGGPPRAVATRSVSSWRERIEAWIADSLPVRRAFANAWVLMDRITDADDSAEVVFRHLRKKHRKINAWFVVDGASEDFRRLRGEGWRRVIPHGTLRWRLLMAHCQHLISSHVDRVIINPPGLDHLVSGRPWAYTFLQHGVIKDDISRWLNGKNIDLMVTSTIAEYESITGDGTPYDLTSKEVVLAELPRFDRLHDLAHKLTDRERNLILITPTWRNWLAPPLTMESAAARASSDFFASDFAVNWLGLVSSERVAEAAREHGMQIAFMPHPNLQYTLRDTPLPDHVLPLTYDGGQIQKTFARTHVLVTDYSSTAFNAAYLGRPVLYFQFDAELVHNGAHQGRPGYFSYDADGFGPVATTLHEAENELIELVRAGTVPEPYSSRLEAAFPYRDGRASERVVRAIKALARSK